MGEREGRWRELGREGGREREREGGREREREGGRREGRREGERGREELGRLTYTLPAQYSSLTLELKVLMLP